MKITASRLAAVALVATALSFTGISRASANEVRIQFGTPPPPPPHEREVRWQRPYRSAVWIEPHFEVIRGRWTWVHGYYTYRPRHNAYWVPGKWYRGYYYPPHWGY